MVQTGAAQVRLFASENSDDDDDDAGSVVVPSWTLPGWIISAPSFSVRMGLGKTKHPTILHARVAQALGIQDGDMVDFEFVETVPTGTTFMGSLSTPGLLDRVSSWLELTLTAIGRYFDYLVWSRTWRNVSVDFVSVQVGERFRLPVTVRDDVPTAFLLNGAVTPAGIAESFSWATAEQLHFRSGRSLNLEMQSFWTGLGIVPTPVACAVLYFGASSSGNGCSGYGYCVRQADETGRVIGRDPLLIQGYGYSPTSGSNHHRMAYEGLVEGLWWSALLNVKKLHVRGDSDLVVNQASATGTVHSRNLEYRAYQRQVKKLLKHARGKNIQCVFEHISSESNDLAISLAGKGIDRKENATTVKWENCNKL